MAESKVVERPFYKPYAGSIEGLPTSLQLFYAAPLIMLAPHWHAQIEVNYIVRGWVHYRMSDHAVMLEEGQMALFWGGLPHYMDDASEDAIYAGGHLPLIYFFRLRLPDAIAHRLMLGATLVTGTTDDSDPVSFARWSQFARSGDPDKAQHAAEELLLRLERVRFDPFHMIPGDDQVAGPHARYDSQASRCVLRMCAFVADHFLEDIDSTDIAAAAAIHPKYAMSVFKKSTGMTINEYVCLLRLSFAQARLLSEDVNVLSVAMDSGFGSLSAFNKAFRRIAGMSPSDFRRDARIRPTLPAERQRAPN